MAEVLNNHCAKKCQAYCIVIDSINEQHDAVMASKLTSSIDIIVYGNRNPLLLPVVQFSVIPDTFATNTDNKAGGIDNNNNSSSKAGQQVRPFQETRDRENMASRKENGRCICCCRSTTSTINRW
jgi:hypothetical protein